ncbi:hypothetical protein DOTSEDRAFT_56999 [Dothistroma septosporum NZE10]|uniref:BTB domain-containing protein n=1 Tax=Dothistroma septosporum (strain NZE10 / CBS 128990) TaxID=675120 RepID=M2WL47_DOTSN|nr:hypothetical protein DOTSEDRAFT_56999 [Dothistroma septosporum NZE10]
MSTSSTPPFHEVTYNAKGAAKALRTWAMNFIFIPHKLASPGVFSMASQIETASDALALLYKTGTLKQSNGNDKQFHANGINGNSSGRSSFDNNSSSKSYANVLKQHDHHHRNGISPGLTDDRMNAFETACIPPKHDPDQPENGDLKPQLEKAKVAKLTSGILKQAYQQNAKAESTEAVTVNRVSFDMKATAYKREKQQQQQPNREQLEQQLQNLEDYMAQRSQGPQQDDRPDGQQNEHHGDEQDQQQHDWDDDLQTDQETEQQNRQADVQADDNETDEYYDREAAQNFTFAVLRQTRDPAYLDFTISHEGTDYKVNSLIISALSTAFQEVITAAKDANESRVELKADSALAVKTMIDFFQSLNYSTPKTLSRLEAAQHHVSVYLIAEKYDIPGLRDLSVWRFERPFSDWGYSKDVLIRMLPDLTEFVYANTPEKCPLRVALLRVWANALRPRNFESVDFEPLIDDFPSFGADIIHVLASFASRSDRPEPGYDDFGNAMGPDGYESERGGHGQVGYDAGWNDEEDGDEGGF